MTSGLMDGKAETASVSTDEVIRYIDPAQFRVLMVSHRRMERAPDIRAGYRALRDLDTGELFLVDERRLIGSQR